MKLFGMCIDKRVVGGIVGAGGLLWWLAPGAFAAALPLLIVAICPLSMLVMMKAMNNDQSGTPSQAPAPPAEAPAHPGGPDGRDDVAAIVAAASNIDARRN